METATAQDKAKDVADQAQERVGEAAQQARGRISDQVDRRSTEIGKQVSSNADDARSVAQALRDQGKEGPAKMAEQAAARAERAGSWLQEADGDRILRQVEDLGRKNPWAVALGGLALGFAASRMLKASSSERYRSSQARPQNALPVTEQPGVAHDAGVGNGQGGL